MLPRIAIRSLVLVCVLLAVTAKPSIPAHGMGNSRPLSMAGDEPIERDLQLPTTLKKITPDNAARLHVVARWGQGAIRGISLSQDGKTFAVASATGFSLYATSNFESVQNLIPTDRPANDAADFHARHRQYAGAVRDQLEWSECMRTGWKVIWYKLCRRVET